MEAVRGSCLNNSDVLGERLESLSIGLNYRNRNVATFAGVYISHNPGFMRVCACNDFALGAFFDF
jgi:hypothetical protein